MLSTAGRKVHGVIPYGVESRDLGGWSEVIDQGALSETTFGDLVVTIDHAGMPLGRYPGTLELDHRADGLHWSVAVPESRADVRESVQRGDLRAGSWRMVVSDFEWIGDVRHVKQIRELHDVSLVTNAAYPDAAVEYRSTSAAARPATAPAEPATEPPEAAAPDADVAPVPDAVASDAVVPDQPAPTPAVRERRHR